MEPMPRFDSPLLVDGRCSAPGKWVRWLSLKYTHMESEMKFSALATDFDGTLARNSKVECSTVAALQAFADSGRKLFLASGRQLEDLLEVFPHHKVFNWILAENGAVMHSPRTGEIRLLGDPPPKEFQMLLGASTVANVSVGRVAVATRRPYERDVLEAFRELGVDRQISFNKDVVLFLPADVNKATGLAAAFRREQISNRDVIAVGDAENDLPMFSLAGIGAAVGNALESVKLRADLILKGEHGSGVEELIEAVLRDDLASVIPSRHLRASLNSQ